MIRKKKYCHKDLRTAGGLRTFEYHDEFYVRILEAFELGNSNKVGKAVNVLLFLLL